MGTTLLRHSLVWALVSLFVLGALVGCTSVKVHPQAISAEIKTIAVFPFEDKDARLEPRDHFLCGVTSVRDSGTVVADILRGAFVKEGNYKIVSRTQTIASLKSRKISETETEKARIELAKELGAEAAVVGRVTRFHQKWFLFFSWSNVRWEASCVDVASGKTIWTARACSFLPYSLEEDLVWKQAGKLVSKVKQLRLPVTPGQRQD